MLHLKMTHFGISANFSMSEIAVRQPNTFCFNRITNILQLTSGHESYELNLTYSERETQRMAVFETLGYNEQVPNL